MLLVFDPVGVLAPTTGGVCTNKMGWNRIGGRIYDEVDSLLKILEHFSRTLAVSRVQSML